MKLRPALHLTCTALGYFSLATGSPLRAANLDWDPAITGGVTLGGTGSWTNTTPLNWWNGTADQGWTDTTGVDIAVLGGSTPGTVTIPSGTTIVGNGLTFATDGYTVAGPGGFNFRGTTPTLTVGTGITGTFNAANNQNGVAAFNVTGGGTLNWGAAGNGSQMTILGGTTVNLTNATGQALGGGTDTITSGSLNLLATGTADQIFDSAQITGATTGTFNLNGISEKIGSLAGNVNVTNNGSAPATLHIATSSTATYTGTISDGAGVTSLRTQGSFVSGTGFTLVTNNATTTFGGKNTYTGTTTLGRSPFTLDFANAAAPATDILYNGVTFGAGNGALVFDGNTSGSQGLNTRSVLSLLGKASTINSQRFNGTTLNANAAAGFVLTPNATGNSVTLDLGAITRQSGSLVNTGTLSATAIINTSSGTAGQVLTDSGGTAYFTINSADWAAKDPTNTFLAAATYSPNTTTALGSGNANVVSGINTRLLADTTVTTLRSNVGEGRNIDLNGKTLTTGGILIGNGVGSSASGISGGTLAGPGNEVVLVHQASGSYRYFGLGATIPDGSGGPVAFTKGGSGGTLLTGNNTFTGTLNANQGALIVTGSNTPAATIITGTTTGIIGGHLQGGGNNSGTFLQLGNAGTTGSIGTGPITLGALGVLAIKRSDSVALNNVITGSGGVQQAWSGTTTLSAPNTSYLYKGETSVTAGILRLDYSTNNNSKLDDGAASLRLGGGTIQMSGGTHTEIVNNLSFATGASTIDRIGGATGRLRLNTITNLSSTTTASVAGATLNLTAASIADTDSLNINGILGRTARATVAGADWAVNSTNGTDGIITALGTYTALATSGATDVNNSILNNAGATLAATRGTNSLKIANTSGSLQTLDLGGFTQTLTSGGLLITGANDVIISNGTLNSGTLTNSDLVVHQYSSGTLSLNNVIGLGTGVQTLTKSGPGTLVLGGTNLFTGQTFLNGGITTVTANANLGAVATGAAVNLNNATLRADATFALNNGAPGTNARAINLNGIGGTLDVTGANTFTVTGSLTGPGGLTKTGSGTVLFSTGGHNYTGPTAVNEGVVRAGSGTVLSFFSDWTLANTAGAALDLGGFSQTIGSLAGGGTTGGKVTSSVAGAVTLTTGSNFSSSSYAGTIENGSGTVALTKMGYGTFTLTGANTYTGATAVNAGTLLVNGSLANTAVTVNSTGTLGGTGTITGLVTANLGGIVSPGASIGTLSTGAVDLSPGGQLKIEFDGGGSQATDILTIAGNFTLGGTSSIDFLQIGTPLTLPVYTFATFTGTLGGTFANVSNLPSGYNLDYGGAAPNGVSLVAVPEASTAFLALGSLALLARRRRA